MIPTYFAFISLVLLAGWLIIICLFNDDCINNLFYNSIDPCRKFLQQVVDAEPMQLLF